MQVNKVMDIFHSLPHRASHRYGRLSRVQQKCDKNINWRASHNIYNHITSANNNVPEPVGNCTSLSSTRNFSSFYLDLLGCDCVSAFGTRYEIETCLLRRAGGSRISCEFLHRRTETNRRHLLQRFMCVCVCVCV